MLLLVPIVLEHLDNKNMLFIIKEKANIMSLCWDALYMHEHRRRIHRLIQDAAQSTGSTSLASYKLPLSYIMYSFRIWHSY